MFLTLDNYFNEEPAAIVQVDASVIDVSDFQDEEDQSFLITHGHELMRIDAKAEQAKEQICKAIDARAEDAKGKLIYEIQERFKTPELRGGLYRYFHSLGYWHPNMKAMDLQKPENCVGDLNAAFMWANAYRAALEMHKKLAGAMSPEEIQTRAESLSSSALAKIYTTHSEADREKFYQEVASGETITHREAVERSRNPEVKLSRAQELLEAARERKQKAEQAWEAVKANHEITSSDDEYKDAANGSRDAKRDTKNWEARVASLEAELEKFKFDEDLKRQQRIKALTAALTVGVPQTTADLNKYIRDAEYYPAEVRAHMNEQIKVLADMCGDYLSRI